MSVATDIQLAVGDHVVHFYSGEDDLVATVVGYLRAAVRSGDTVIVIATPEHREAFGAGLHPSTDGHVLMLDAAETLSRFMVDGSPDPDRFDAVVGDVVREACGSGRPVRAYGEMVTLLWEAGLVAGAIELETLWNGLSERAPFSLLCAYPFDAVADPQSADDFAAVCHLHSSVLTGAPWPEADVAQRFAGTLQASHLARQFVTETLQAWGREDLVEDAVLVVAELASNAVRHASSDVTVGLSRIGDAVRLEVGDAGTTPPVRRRSRPVDVGGRGLVLIDGLSVRWGHRLVNGGGGGGKVVWADLV